jgi:phytoene dehydrogenase-like protein
MTMAAKPPVYDAIIIGGGHNGLVTAAYLGKSGQKTLVIERQLQLGGAASTEEVFPGYRVDTGSFDASLLLKSIISELGLEQYDLKMIGAPVLAFAPHPESTSFTLWRDQQETQKEIQRLSPKDAERYPLFTKSIVRMAELLREIWTLSPPNLPKVDYMEITPWLGVARKVRQSGRRDMMEFLRILPMPIKDYLDEWFENPQLKGVLGSRALLGNFQGPYSPGTMFNFLYSTPGEQAGGLNSSQIVRGGMGRLAEALAMAARERGVEIRQGIPVEKILIEDGRAQGVVLGDGELLYARTVISSASPRHSFFDLVRTDHLDVSYVRDLMNIRYQGCTARVILGLEGMPHFRSAASRESIVKEGTLLSGRIVHCPDLDYLERAYDQAKYGEFSSQPYLEIVLPTMLDASLAPPGKHLMLINVQYAPYHLKVGKWEDQRENLTATVLRMLEELAPGIGGLVSHQLTLTPADLEQRYGLPEGCIFHGQMSLDQQLFMRPVPGFGSYRTPIRNLYLCGSGAHPGGGVTGAPGYNAARLVIKDLSRRSS